MIKKMTAVLTAVAAALTFASCGNKKNDSSAADKNSNASAAKSADASSGASGQDEDAPKLPESTARVSFELDRSVWLTREDYESKAESGDEDKLELDKAYSDDDVETMYVMSDGSPSDGAAVFYVTKPVYSPSYTKDTVPIIVNSVNEAMQQDIDMGETYEFISCTAYDVGEYSAVHAVQKDKVFGIPMKMDHYQFFEDGDVFIVNFCAPADRYDDLKPEFDSIIKSIKIDH